MGGVAKRYATTGSAGFALLLLSLSRCSVHTSLWTSPIAHKDLLEQAAGGTPTPSALLGGPGPLSQRLHLLLIFAGIILDKMGVRLTSPPLRAW